MDGRYDERNSMASKSHSFGSYGQHASLSRDDSINSNKSTGSRFHKQDSTTSTTWRLSPSSSGYNFLRFFSYDFLFKKKNKF